MSSIQDNVDGGLVLVTPKVGSRLGDHVLTRRLGLGGMGEVFAARHVDSGEHVALKVLTRTHAISRYRFKREFRAVADIDHPNLIRLHELVLPERGLAYFTMDLIEGRALVLAAREGVAAGELPPLERIEHLFRQLLAGLAKLHAGDIVHRDLKPSNVIVDGSERVVILDFGLVTASHADGLTRDGQVLGTPKYMAPEQARGDRVGATADLYALGVMLFECLTGELPSAERDARLSEVPAHLRSLCTGLLARKPDARPSAQHALAKLGARERSTDAAAPLFVGRRDELARLRAAAEAVRERGVTHLVLVHAPIGYGRTTLLRRFIAEREAEAKATGEPLLVLRSSCRERETLPYKGVDALIDELAVYLRQLPDARRDPLRPRDLDALVRVFPILSGIWSTPSPVPLGPTPQTTRYLAWAALRELFEQLGQDALVIVHVDDLQWANVESIELLRALTWPPEAPRLLVVLSFRSAARHAPQLQSLFVGHADDDAEMSEIELGPLAEDEGRALARDALRRAGFASSDDLGRLQMRAEALALRAGGDPLFINQAALIGDALAEARELDEVIGQRLAQLDPSDADLVDLVAVAGGPLALADLAALAPAYDDARVDGLCDQGLLVRSAERVEISHDRIRVLVVDRLDLASQRRTHRAVAERLLATQGAADDHLFVIVDHFNASLTETLELEPDRRLELAGLNRDAGERALEASAWSTAARYFEIARSLVAERLDEARRGRGPRELCLAIKLGRAQALAMTGAGEPGALFEPLLRWELDTREHSEVVTRQVAMASYHQDWELAVAAGLAGLARLGRPMGREPSMARVLAALVLASRAVAKLELDTLVALPAIADPQTGATLDILGAMTQATFAVDPKLFVVQCSAQTRLMLDAGYHPSLAPTLARLAISIAATGKPREAGELCDLAQRLIARRKTSVVDTVLTQLVALLFVWPQCRPFNDLADQVEGLHTRSLAAGLREYAGYTASIGLGICLESARSLPELQRMSERFEARDPSYGGPEGLAISRTYRQFIRAMLTGAEPMAPEELDDEVSLINHHIARIFALASAVLRGDYARAWTCLEAIPPDYEQVLMGNWHIPRCAVFSAIAVAERWPQLDRRGRRRARRRLRRAAKLTARWAANSTENYGPMAAITAGELAVVRSDHERAHASYEHARTLAAATGVAYLEGLACARLGRLANARGHTATAEGLLRTAGEIYTRWGAPSLATPVPN